MKLKVSTLLARVCAVICLSAVAAVLLTGCGGKEPQKDIAPTDTPAAATQAPTATTAPTETPTPTEEPTPTPTPTPTPDPYAGMYRSELTNEWMPIEFKDQRPIAVMMNNLLPGTPQSSINKAGVVYECKVEGNITRLLAIIQDWRSLTKIGSVRSARKSYVFWELEWDPIYLHYGASSVAQPFLNRKDVNNLDGQLYEGLVFYRTTDRKAPHNAYASGEGVLKGAEKKGYSLTHTDHYVPEHFKFAPDDAPTVLTNGKEGRIVRPGYEENTPWFEYRAEEGIYYRFQYGKEHIDNIDNRQITCTNIIIQIAESQVVDDAGHKVYTLHAKNQPGYFCTGGKYIPIKWTKESDYEPTRFYYENGEEIKLNTGKTWICVVRKQDGNKIKFEK